MLIRLLRRVKNDQRGITGLETAIILIAFVMVASVLAYVVLTAGLFSAQKAKEAVHAGLAEVRSTMELKGNVILKMESGYGTELYFTVGCPAASDAIDFTDTSAGENVVVISYIDQNQRVEDLYWQIDKLGDADDDDLLEANEKFQITVGNAVTNTDGGNLVDALDPNLLINQQFSIELKAIPTA